MDVKIGDIFSYSSKTNDVNCKICHQSKSKSKFSVEKHEINKWYIYDFFNFKVNYVFNHGFLL